MKKWFDLLPQGRPFVKMQGLSNHFVVVDGREVPFKPTKEEIISICNIGEGAGAEELMVIEPVTEHGEGAYARARIYNPDGMEAEACGNATRCVARLLLEESGLDELGIEINFQVLHCKWDGNMVCVEMGPVSMEWQKIPLAKECDTLNVDIESGPVSNPVAANVGNPHIVFFTDDLDSVDMYQVGPDVQKNALLPESANVGVAQIIDDTHIKLQVWERPSVLTMACGSGSCAAVASAIARGLIKSDYAHVEMPGGNMKIAIKEGNVAVMTGPAEYCYSGFLMNE